MTDECWPSFDDCEVHRPGRTPASQVHKSIACLTKPGCVLMHGHRGACTTEETP